MEDSLKKRNPVKEQQKQIVNILLSSSSSASAAAAASNSSTSTSKATSKATSTSIEAAALDQDNIDRPYTSDFHKCSSPEFDKVPWTFREETETETTIKTKTKTATKTSAKSKAEPFLPSCGTDASIKSKRKSNGKVVGKLSPFHEGLKTVWEKQIRYLANETICSDLVVFGEAFDSDIKKVIFALDPHDGDGDDDGDNKIDMYSKRRSKMQSNHGNCFFVFVYEENLLDWNMNMKNSNKNSNSNSNNNNTTLISNSAFTMAGHNWVIPVDRAIFPYESTSRNSNLFRYSGQFLFPDANTIVYQDYTNFFLPSNLQKQPTNYHEIYPRNLNEATGSKQTKSSSSSNSNSNAINAINAINNDPCLTVFALPKNEKTVGQKYLQRDEELFQGHCKFILSSLSSKKKINNNNTNSATAASSLVQQCNAYLQYVNKRELDTIILNQGMIESNIWLEPII